MVHIVHTPKMVVALRLLPVALLFVLTQRATLTAGQGLLLSKAKPVGVTNNIEQLKELYSNSEAWKHTYKLNAASACSSSSSKSMCAAAASQNEDAQLRLMLAASPQTYSTLDAKYSGGCRLVSTPLNQKPCDTCSAFAVASAAETTMATVLGVDVTECSISVQALYFCPPGGLPGISCKGGSTFESMLTLLSKTSSSLPTSDCMEYNPDSVYGDSTSGNSCKSRCQATNQHAQDGTFKSQRIVTMWDAQRHIRQYGAVVARFDIMGDFSSFFAKYENAQAIYKPKSDQFVGHHAVVLVGYNNVENYWRVKNSWGPDWADGGYFKVAYGECSVLTDNGEAYGLIWDSNKPSAVQQLQVSPGPKPGCYLYQARSGDYMSKIAFLAGIELDTLMIDNTGTVKDLDAPLDGKELIICNPMPGRYAVVQGKPAPADAPTPVSQAAPKGSLPLPASKSQNRQDSRELPNIYGCVVLGNTNLRNCARCACQGVSSLGRRCSCKGQCDASYKVCDGTKDLQANCDCSAGA